MCFGVGGWAELGSGMRNVIIRELALGRRDSFGHKVGIRCFDVKNVGKRVKSQVKRV